MVNQLNYHFSWTVVRIIVAMGCNNTYASGVKYQKKRKTQRLLSVSMLWSSVLSDRLLSLSNADSLNSLNFFISKSNLQTIKPAASTCCTCRYSLDCITSKPQLIIMCGCSVCFSAVQISHITQQTALSPFFELLNRTRTFGILFLSGIRHLSENVINKNMKKKQRSYPTTQPQNLQTSI